MRVVLDSGDVARGLRRVAGEIIERNRGSRDLVIVGVRRGGVAVADELVRFLRELEGHDIPEGSVDITLYRDDAATALPNPRIGPSAIPCSLDGKIVVLVDDVVYTGRTIRAALDALMDYGRPRRIELAALVDRGGRELPIRADYVVRSVEVGELERIDVIAAPEGLSAVVQPKTAPSHPPGVAMTERLRHLLSTHDLDRESAERILSTARVFQEVARRPIKKVPTLRGKTIVNLFYEASTRTRTSFELAGKRLSADVVNVGGLSSSVSKGETLSDTVRTLDAMHPDVIVIRHAASGAAAYVAARTRASVVNAGDGLHQHPTQALLDAFTIQSHKGSLEGLTVAICGDIMHSRVARSNAELLPMLGATVRLAGPATLLPRDPAALGCAVFDRLEPALEGADVVMMLRIQRERLGGAYFPTLREYSRVYGLNKKRLALARPDALVMHPGPLNRGVEISDDVADGERSIILDQVESGVAVRMAVLYMTANEPEAQISI